VLVAVPVVVRGDSAGLQRSEEGFACYDGELEKNYFVIRYS